MRLSFVVPAYNEELYLADCLQSILDEIRSQPPCAPDGIDFEVIVVNNASTDRTRDVALGYPGVRVVDEPRKGLYSARQAGFEASSGALIANVDADSRLLPAGSRTSLPSSPRTPISSRCPVQFSITTFCRANAFWSRSST